MIWSKKGQLTFFFMKIIQVEGQLMKTANRNIILRSDRAYNFVCFFRSDVINDPPFFRFDHYIPHFSL
jgi:hypothetical protein